MQPTNPSSRILLAAAAFCATAAMIGCGTSIGGSNQPAPPITITGSGLRGSIYGGQQPIAGSTLYLFAAGTTGYASTNPNKLTSPVKSNADGSFNIDSLYACYPGDQMYLVAVGGDPGNGTNANVAQMAALGDCSGLSHSTFISMNEVTTVGGIFALSPFMKGYADLGTSPSNIAGLKRAFASVNKLVNFSTGSAPGPALPAGATAPALEIYTLADVMAACVNSTGGVAGDGSACGNLFTYATPPGGTAPTDTIGALLAIAQNPTLNVRNLYRLPRPSAPFQPQLGAEPHDWTMSINYTSGGFNKPKSTTVDAHGNVWVANSGNNTITLLTQTGIPTTVSGNGLNAPAAIAIDAAGNAWVANQGAATVSSFTSSGGTFPNSPFTGAGLNNPSAIAIDAPGNIWVTNSGSPSVSELSSTGAPVQELTSGVVSPAALAINPK